jgi:hypothetical protein
VASRNVDYGHGSGFFVRVDVELPKATLYRGQRSDGGPMGFLSLSAEEAESLATRLSEVARRVRGKSVHGAKHGSAQVPLLAASAARAATVR